MTKKNHEIWAKAEDLAPRWSCALGPACATGVSIPAKGILATAFSDAIHRLKARIIAGAHPATFHLD